MKEVRLGRMLGPLPVQPIDPLICSLVGMVPKCDSQEMWHITHLSHLWGRSINTFINQEDAQTHYQPFEAAVELVAQASPGSYMVKEDFKSAFCNVPMCFADLNLPGIKVKGQFFIDTCLPFGASISCAIFEDISTLIHWIAERQAGHALVHYLDDFFMVRCLPYVCGRIMSSFKEVCNKIGMPIFPEKAVGPVQVIQFLGLTIDTIGMVIKVPEDKRVDILTIITKIIQKRKATSLNLQSLAGKLNFLCKAVPASRPFIKNVYEAFTGIPQQRHIDLKGNVLADLRMWKAFLLQFRSWQPIISNQQRAKDVVELYANTSGNPSLGWGAFLPSKGLWMFQQWEQEWFHQFNPSIDFLELYALLAGVVTWVPHLSDKTVIFRSDNTPTVHALINKSSNSMQMLRLLHYFTLFCMIHNIHIKALHISGKKNIICDLLS